MAFARICDIAQCDIWLKALIYLLLITGEGISLHFGGWLSR